MRVLIVEDEHALASAMRRAVEREGYEVSIADSARGAVDVARRWRPDLVLLDIRLPDGDGRDVARALQSMSSTPIMFVTGESDVITRIVGLDIGADDYIVKPFDMNELLARIRAVTRRARDNALRPVERLTHADLTLDLEAQRAWRGTDELTVTVKEFEILRLLMERQGALVRRSLLAETVWGEPLSLVTKTLDMHVSALRRKLDDDPRNPHYIETVRGLGFRLLDADV